MKKKKIDPNKWFYNWLIFWQRNIRPKTSLLRSDLCDYSDKYFVVKETTAEGDNDDKARNKKLIFENSNSFGWCILKINNTFIDNTEDIDIIVSMSYEKLFYDIREFVEFL